MLTPKEKPFLEGLNSYYLNLERLTEHLQGEIGAGCIYGKAVSREILIYFDESDVIRSFIQEKGQGAAHSEDLSVVEQPFKQYSFVLKIFSLDPYAIFFWGHMPAYQRAKSSLKSAEIPLPDLIFRLRQKQFSGFIDVDIANKQEGGLLFFHEGNRIGGSYSWGRGGMSKSDEDYNLLLSKVQAGEGIFRFGSYVKEISENAAQEALEKNSAPQQTVKVKNPVYNELRPALEEFLFYFVQAMQEKGKENPILDLQQYIAENLEKYSSLNPGLGHFEYMKGIIRFSEDAPAEKIAKDFIACAWEVIHSSKADETFRKKLSSMRAKTALTQRNVSLERI
ncbi:hypothetical protein [Desulfogranum japonicum]|uniref:hypothetical protein n=1 Tax=Desulfogranum japonicum TaxID=231447 RepID=UPI0004222C51|nr:hypothetical protein [Desulfogranum japonicum]